MSFDTLDAPAGILVRGAGCGPGVSVILRSDATKDLISLARSWLLKRDIRSFASLRMTIGLRTRTRILHHGFLVAGGADGVGCLAFGVGAAPLGAPGNGTWDFGWFAARVESATVRIFCAL